MPMLDLNLVRCGLEWCIWRLLGGVDINVAVDNGSDNDDDGNDGAKDETSVEEEMASAAAAVTRVDTDLVQVGLGARTRTGLDTFR
jgi:hypothetical protein